MTCSVVSLLLSGCANRFHHRDDIEMINSSELRSRIDDQKPAALLVFDTRPSPEFELAHIPTARNFQLADCGPVRRADGRISQFEMIVVYGDSAESPEARAVLKRLLAIGYADVRLLRSGFNGWKSSGFPIASGASTPLPPPGFWKPNYTSD